MAHRIVSWQTENVTVPSKPSHQAFSFSSSSVTRITHRRIIFGITIAWWTKPTFQTQPFPSWVTRITWGWIIGWLTIQIAVIFSEPTLQTNLLSLRIASVTRHRVISRQTMHFATRAIPAMQTDLSSCTRLTRVVPVYRIIMGCAVYLTAWPMPTNSTNNVTSSFIASIVTRSIVVTFYTVCGTAGPIIVLITLHRVLQHCRGGVASQNYLPPLYWWGPGWGNNSYPAFIPIHEIIWKMVIVHSLDSHYKWALKNRSFLWVWNDQALVKARKSWDLKNRIQSPFIRRTSTVLNSVVKGSTDV